MKGIVLYDLREDAFTIAEHNVEDDAVGGLLARYRGKGLPAYEFSHARRHRTEPADGCRTCARIAQAVLTRNRGGTG
jgi:hypothetical protein